MTQVVAGRYRLLAEIGSGGSGTVWRAEDVHLHRVVAVKEVRMPPNISPEHYAETTARALAEGRVAARLQHPNIVTVHDVVEHDGRPWIIMQHIAGDSLERALAGGGVLPVDQAARIGVDLLRAIMAAHEAGVIHRDVKPSNVLVGADARVYLTDFSIARVTGTATVTNTGVLIGSPGYIAPELIVTGKVAEPADLFGLGATLFRMVEGSGPFDRQEAIAGAFAAAVAPHPRPQRAGELTAVIDGLLAKDPRERLDAAGALALLTPLAAAALDQTFLGAPAAGPAQAASGHAPSGTATGNQASPSAAADAAGRGSEPPVRGDAARGSDAPVFGGAAGGFAAGQSSSTPAFGAAGGGFAAGQSPGTPAFGAAGRGADTPVFGDAAAGAAGGFAVGRVSDLPVTPVWGEAAAPQSSVEGGTGRWKFQVPFAKKAPPILAPEDDDPRPVPGRRHLVPVAVAAALVLVTSFIVYGFTQISTPSPGTALPTPPGSPSTSDASSSPAATPTGSPLASPSPEAQPTTKQPPPPPKPPAPVTSVSRSAPGCGESDSRVVWSPAKAGVACSSAGTTVSKQVGWDEAYQQSYAQLRMSLKNQQLPGTFTVSFTIGGLSGPELSANRGGCGGLAVHTSADGRTYSYFNVCADGWVESVSVVNNTTLDDQQRQITPGPVQGTSPSYSVVVNVNPSAMQVTVSNRVGQSVTITSQAAGPSTAYISLLTVWRNVGATARFSDFRYSAG